MASLALNSLNLQKLVVNKLKKKKYLTIIIFLSGLSLLKVKIFGAYN